MSRGSRAKLVAPEGLLVEHIEDLLKASIAEICGVDAAMLRPDTRLEDIGVDSLASAEVLVDLEIRLGRQLPTGTLRRLETAATVADVAALLEVAFAAPRQGLA
jgi:acyl carrier protein